MTAGIQVKIKEMAFKEWTTQALMREFMLKKVKSCSILDDWLTMPYAIREREKEVLGELREVVAEEALFWNEDELKLNNNNKAIYGAYVIGRNWFFVTLKDKDYCVSNNFSASQEDELNAIFKTLKAIKTIIETDLMD